MRIKQAGILAATAAVAALSLTACGPSDDSGAPAASAPATATAGGTAAGDAVNRMAAQADLSLMSGTAQSNNAPRNTGDFVNQPGKQTTPAGAKWVGLVAAKAGALNPVVLNGAGFTLYRFDKDTANPSKSNCNDACATTWPPLVVAPHGKIFIKGVAKKDVGVVKRDDGRLQVTIGGWPVYRFSKDLKPGDTNGQGVGGTWFGVTPNGGKAGQAAAGGEAAAPGGKPGTRVQLFDDKNFADNGSQAVSGAQSCEKVFRPTVASSLKTDGTVKIWDGPNCTGRSAVVNGDIRDLSTIGFDNRIASIRFS
ncbi:hypothetical protein KUM39_06000 [Streptomyces sp. J2-1]|uniref:hypothetical protein n=1 Tax=Streptomyces corallincola TaxID=2851888 RepID=UPI001C3824B8|nr:hypothetical protein [Streptomyces corallincola]MBV2353915.1 hypothetical protein [Streptomyces corallincola]